METGRALGFAVGIPEMKGCNAHSVPSAESSASPRWLSGRRLPRRPGSPYGAWPLGVYRFPAREDGMPHQDAGPGGAVPRNGPGDTSLTLGIVALVGSF